MNYMTDLIQFVFFLVILTSLSVVCGNYFAKVFQGEKNFLSPLLSHFEKLIYKLLKINPDQQMDWKEYTKNLLIFSVLGILILIIFQVTQQYLPLNPQKIKNVNMLLALNTAISFVRIQTGSLILVKRHSVILFR